MEKLDKNQDMFSGRGYDCVCHDCGETLGYIVRGRRRLL